MKNRFLLAVGVFFLGYVCSIKAGMMWEEWTPENGIVDGQAALQEMLEAGKMPDENWQEKALAFINAFEKLKLQLQFFWRSQVGDGAIVGDPWNGVSDGGIWYRAKGFFKRDCPIVLHFWLNGHIGKHVRKVNDYHTETYEISARHCVPMSAMFSDKDFKKAKGRFKKHILTLFKEKNLQDCALFLNQKFCKSISNLVIEIIEKLQVGSSMQKQNLEILFQLYGVYNYIDVFEFPFVAQENYNRTTDKVCTLVADCCYEVNNLNPECKTWMINLFKNYNKDPYREGAGIGQYNLDLTLIIHKFLSKFKIEPRKLEVEFVKVMNVVIEDWQQQSRKIEGIEKNTEVLHIWNQACVSLHNALYN